MSHHYIQFQDVHYAYPDGHEALSGVTFRATHGQKVALLGLNGSGKSTLLLATAGLVMPTSGSIDIGGVPVCKKTLRLIHQTVGVVFQNPDDQLFMPTVYEDVAFGPTNMGLPPDEVDRRVHEALQRVGVEDLASRAPSSLSGGQQRSVAIATVLSMYPDILVLDEPTENLDCRSRQNLIDVIRRFEHTLLLATHDLQLARTLCTHALVLDAGRLVTFCPIDQLTDDILAKAGLIYEPA